MIVAIAQNGAIGKDNDLLWHISDDLKHFKAITSGHPVVMGRKTWESLPKKPLPKRRNIVISRDESFAPEGAEVFHSINSLLKKLPEDEEVFVMGGAAIYEALLPWTEKLYVTKVNADFEADVFFPTIDESVFRKVHCSETMIDEASGLSFEYVDYERKPGTLSWPF